MSVSGATSAYDGAAAPHGRSGHGVARGPEKPRTGPVLRPIVVIRMAPPSVPVGDEVLADIRETLAGIVEGAFGSAGVLWGSCHAEWRGELVVITVPTDVPADRLLDDLVARLRAGVRRHNRLSSEMAKIRLRMAVHVGRVVFTRLGISSVAVNRMMAFLEAPAFVREFDELSAELGLVASDYLFEEYIRYGSGLIEPAAYEEIKVPTGHEQVCAWMHFPGRSARPLRPAADARDVALSGHCDRDHGRAAPDRPASDRREGLGPERPPDRRSGSAAGAARRSREDPSTGQGDQPRFAERAASGRRGGAWAEAWRRARWPVAQSRAARPTRLAPATR
jgi:hypothetical protein